MATLREFEDILREFGMTSALGLLEMLRERDRAKKQIARPRRATARRMTPELAQKVRELHRTTMFTQQEIAFKLGVNQGRVNEVIKHGKWLDSKADGSEPVVRAGAPRRARLQPRATASGRKRPDRVPSDRAQLPLGDF